MLVESVSYWLKGQSIEKRGQIKRNITRPALNRPIEITYRFNRYSYGLL